MSFLIRSACYTRLLQLRHRVGFILIDATARFICNPQFPASIIPGKRTFVHLAAWIYKQSQVTKSENLLRAATALHEALRGAEITRICPELSVSNAASGGEFEITFSGWGGDVTRGIPASELIILPRPSRARVTFNHRRADVKRAFRKAGLSRSGFRATCFYPSAPKELRVFVRVDQNVLEAVPTHAPDGMWGRFGNAHFTNQRPPNLAYIDQMDVPLSPTPKSWLLDFLELRLVCEGPSKELSELLTPFAANLVENMFTRQELLMEVAQDCHLPGLGLKRVDWKLITQPTGLETARVYLPQFLGHSAKRTRMKYEESTVTVPEVSSLNHVLSIHKHLLVNSSGQIVITDKNAQPSLLQVAGQWNVLAGSKSHSNRALAKAWAPPSRELHEAIHLVGRADENYFHAMIETLPKIVHFLESKRYASLPILVNESLPDACVKALGNLVDPSRLISRGGEETILVETLWVAHAHFHLQDSPRELWKHSAQVYWPVIQEFRDRVLAVVNLDGNPYQDSRIFIKRSMSSGRNRLLINESEIIEVAESLGFTVIDPSVLELEEQIRVFNGASVICGPGGAGLTNLVFCTPSTRVVSLNSDELSDFATFSTMAGHAGLYFGMIPGPRRMSLSKASSRNDILHSDFMIDPFRFRRQLRSLL